jgi:hypothetical protein
MTSRLNVFAAALGLVLATGTLADASAKTATTAHKIHQVHAKTVATKTATKAHRLHVAHRHHAPKLFVSRHLKGHRVVTSHVAPKTSKEAGATVHRERHAMNHTTKKPITVVR